MLGVHYNFFNLISDGIKQGGIFSPILFNVYLDSLSVKLNAPNIGSDMGGGGGVCKLTLYVMQVYHLLVCNSILNNYGDIYANKNISYCLICDNVV